MQPIPLVENHEHVIIIHHLHSTISEQHRSLTPPKAATKNNGVEMSPQKHKHFFLYFIQITGNLSINTSIVMNSKMGHILHQTLGFTTCWNGESKKLKYGGKNPTHIHWSLEANWHRDLGGMNDKS